MDPCPARASCFYLNLIRTRQEAIKHLVEEFCDGRYELCARYMLQKAYGPRKVPKYLLPEDTREACKILDGKGA